jgi:hypothetical protein
MPSFAEGTDRTIRSSPIVIGKFVPSARGVRRVLEIGNHALYFSIVREVTVHAFEPNPVAVRYLRANAKANNERPCSRDSADEKSHGRIAPAGGPGNGKRRAPNERRGQNGERRRCKTLFARLTARFHGRCRSPRMAAS